MIGSNLSFVVVIPAHDWPFLRPNVGRQRVAVHTHQGAHFAATFVSQTAVVATTLLVDLNVVWSDLIITLERKAIAWISECGLA